MSLCISIAVYVFVSWPLSLSLSFSLFFIRTVVALDGFCLVIILGPTFLLVPLVNWLHTAFRFLPVTIFASVIEQSTVLATELHHRPPPPHVPTSFYNSSAIDQKESQTKKTFSLTFIVFFVISVADYTDKRNWTCTVDAASSAQCHTRPALHSQPPRGSLGTSQLSSRSRFSRRLPVHWQDRRKWARPSSRKHVSLAPVRH